MPRIVVVYGPRGCGKTYNAEKIRSALGCGRVIDDVCPDGRRARFRDRHGVYRTYFRERDLVLTSLNRAEVEKFLRRFDGVTATLMTFEDAMSDDAMSVWQR